MKTAEKWLKENYHEFIIHCNATGRKISFFTAMLEKFASQFTPDREVQICSCPEEYNIKWQRTINDGVCSFCGYPVDKIADELTLPDHSEDNLDMISKEEQHKTCDGCEMFSESGCMLIDSCPECVKHYLWTPKEEQDELQALINEIAEWSDKTFGDGQRNPAIVYHLKKEVDEIISIMNNGVVKEYERQTLLMEYADCFMLLMDSVTHSFFSVKDLIETTKAKLEINKKRKWGSPDINGVIEHIEPSKEEQAKDDFTDEDAEHAITGN